MAAKAVHSAVLALQLKVGLTWAYSISGETVVSPGNLTLKAVEKVEPLPTACLNLNWAV